MFNKTWPSFSLYADSDIIQDAPQLVTADEEEKNMKRKTT